MATKEAEAPSGKKVVTIETIREQESDSATDAYDPAKLENTASEMGHSLDMDDVASAELDWTEMAEKDALIAARDDQIAKMQSMVQEYTQLQESYRPVEGDVGAVKQEIAGLDTMLKEEGDALTSAEVAQHVIRRSNLERKLDKMEANKANTNN